MRQVEISEEIRRNLRRTGSGLLVPNLKVNFMASKLTIIPSDCQCNRSFTKFRFSNSYASNKDTTMVWPVDDQGGERRWYLGEIVLFAKLKKVLFGRKE